MSNGYRHSVKVPRIYKVIAKTVQTVEEDGASLKQLIYEKKHPNIQGGYALAVTTIKNGAKLDQVIRKTQLLVKEPRLDPWLARVLITELIWGKQSLPSDAKPVLAVLSYESQLREAAKNLDDAEADAPEDPKVQKPRYVRVNTLVASVEESIETFKEDGWTLLPKSRNYASYLKVLSGKLKESNFLQDFHIPELFAFPPGTQFYDHPAYKCGAIVLQDKASCFPAFLLNPSRGATVLDMCAAPGMKTTHLAAIMQNTGTIFAVEKDMRRYSTLCQLVTKNAATSVKTIHTDAMTLDPTKCSDVEYILVDPSCSGSGMLDRMNLKTSDSKCAPGRLTNLQSFQVLLLRHALLNFPTVKRVVYSTCSVYPEENEMVVDEILGAVGDSYKLVPAKKLLDSNWENFSSNDYKCKDNCLYSRPEVDLSNGFFVAVFERNFDVELPEYHRKILAVKRALNDKSNVSKGQGGEDGGEPVKKRRRKRNKWKVPSENGAETAQIRAEPNEQTSEKKQKKKRKVTTEAVEADENDEAKSTVNTEETSVETKNKKKKKRSASQVNEEVNETVDTSPIEDGTVKKKKKKKKLSESEVTSEVAPTAGTPEEEKTTKKKKKKKKHSESEVTEEPTTKALPLPEGKKAMKNKNKHSRL